MKFLPQKFDIIEFIPQRKFSKKMFFLDFPEIDTGQFQNAPKRFKTERY